MKQHISLNGKTILVTGSPGFIGSNLVIRLLTDTGLMTNGNIVSLDNMNDYYDPKLKEYRLSIIESVAEKSSVNHKFIRGSIADKALVDKIFVEYKPDIVVNLAAQAGVRYSIDHPDVYIESNLIGFYNILEACRHSYDEACMSDAGGDSEAGDVYRGVQHLVYASSSSVYGGNKKVPFSTDDKVDNPVSLYAATKKSNELLAHSYSKLYNIPSTGLVAEGDDGAAYKGVQHLVYASSSSVYGGNKKVPFSTDDKVDNPVSLYAATKKSNELLAHSYSKLYNIPSTGLRFFTVYGPAGRPDMFYYSATEKLVRGETIKIFNYGNMKRDFTYVDDIVEGIIRVMQGAPLKSTGDDGLPVPPYALYNIGGGQPENLLDYVSILQEELVRARVLPEDYDFEGHRELVGMQPGDVPVTYADSKGLEEDYGFVPKIGIREGLRKFAEWYKEYNKLG